MLSARFPPDGTSSRHPPPGLLPLKSQRAIQIFLRSCRRKKGLASAREAPVFADDPAPQQLTAPCRKYSGRLRQPIEQVMYRQFS